MHHAAATRAAKTDPFRHEALLYPDRRVYAMVTTRFIRDGLALDEPALVAVPGGNGEHLRRELGADAERVRFVDMTDAGANPNRIIPWVLRAFMDEHVGRPVRIIGEPVWPGRDHAEVTLALQHEALINKAFAGRSATILCPYDSTGLSSGALMLANRTHPLIRDADRVRPCADYADPDRVVQMLNNPMPPPGGLTVECDFGRNDLLDLRNLVARCASRAGMDRDRIADLRLAVNEVATNTLLHGQGRGTVRVWYDDDRVICEIEGPGRIDDPLAGRLVPSEKDPHGRGLLVANRLCDLVETYTTRASTTTRVHMRF